MTLVPEINLARELGMCYGLIALVTDYDVWVPHQPVTAEAVEKMMIEKIGIIKKVIAEVVPKIPADIPKCREVLRHACV
jgi:5'-methylthioadenosine phosphorylase